MSKMFNVLFIDDDEEILNLIKVFLPEMINVFIATDRKMVKRCILNEEINCIVSDIDMPDLNGLELNSVIREVNKTFPLMIYTAYGSIDYQRKAKDMLVNEFILKPNFDDLKDKLDQLIEMQKKQRFTPEEKKYLLKVL